MKPSPKVSASKILKRRRPGTRPTAAEKAEYVDLIIRDFVSGLNVHEIAKKHGISTASVYRWQRQQDAIQLTLNKNSHPNCVDISSAFDNLCSTPPSNNSAIRDALFQFLTWVRWPFEPGYHLAAMINCTASYLHQTQKSRQIEALSHDDSAFILKYLTLDVIARFSSPYAAFNPDFEIISNKISRYDDRQFFAEIVNYLLEDKLNISGKIYRPTLRSLQSLVEAGAFGEGWSMSTRTFEKYWRARAFISISLC